MSDNTKQQQPAQIVSGVQTNELPTAFEEFERTVGASNWLDRAARISADVKGHPHLASLAREQNRVAFALADLSAAKGALGAGFRIARVNSVAEYEVWALVAQFNQLYQGLIGQAQYSLLRRMQSAFSNPDDMRALQFEWMIAVHMAKRGFAIRFPEQDGMGTFDLLAERGGIQTELECKSVSEEKGRQISRRDATAMQTALRIALEPIARNLKGGMVIRVIVPTKLPTNDLDRSALTKLVVQTVLSGRSASYDELNVQLRDFDVTGSPFNTANPNPELIHQFAETNFGIANRDLMIFFSPGVRVFMLSLESERPDKLIRRTFETIKDASDRQLTGTKAGIVCVKFEAITSDELAEVGKEAGAPSLLRRETSRFLDARRASHLTCLGFFSEDTALKRDQSDVSRGGRSYFFENPESPFYSRDTLVAFGGMNK